MTVAEIISSSLLELFVLGQTSESETAQVLQWKNDYPEVAEEINNIELALEQFALANAIAPSNGAKERLMQSIALAPVELTDVAQAPVISIANTPNRWKWLSAASVVLCLTAATTALVMYNKYKDAANKLADVSVEKQKAENQLDLILTKNTEPLQLKGTPTFPTSSAKIFWVKNTGDVFVASDGLPEAPKGLQYQLWAIIDGKPVDGGMIKKNVKGGRYEVQKMKSFGKAEAFAITLEKEGGSETPTMDKMYVIATI